MVETLKLEEKNMKKIKENAETLVAVEREREREKLFIQHGIRLLDHVYCHLENKKRKLNSSKGRTMPVKQAIALPLCALTEKVEHNHRRGGP